MVGEIALSSNEYKTSERLKKDYWPLCPSSTVAQQPEIHVVRDPVG